MNLDKFSCKSPHYTWCTEIICNLYSNKDVSTLSLFEQLLQYILKQIAIVITLTRIVENVMLILEANNNLVL